MYLAGRNHVVTHRSLIDTMQMFHDIGYKGMELSIVRGNSTVLAWDYMDDYVIDKVNEKSSELDVKVTCMACHQNYVTDDVTFEAQKKLLKTAKKYNTDVVIMSTFIPFENREGHPELYTELAKRTRTLCDIAEEEGVKIAIEVEPNQLVHNLKRFFALVEEVKSPALKLNFDVGHMYLSEVDIFKAMEQSKEFIVYSHIDNMCMGEHCHKLPWDGEINLKEVYDVMKQKYYDGPVSLDLYLQDYEKTAKQCLDYINKEVFCI